MKRTLLKIIIATLLLGGMSSCASWWSATFGPGGPEVTVGGPIGNNFDGGPGAPPPGGPGGPGGPP